MTACCRSTARRRARTRSSPSCAVQPAARSPRRTARSRRPPAPVIWRWRHAIPGISRISTSRSLIPGWPHERHDRSLPACRVRRTRYRGVSREGAGTDARGRSDRNRLLGPSLAPADRGAVCSSTMTDGVSVLFGAVGAVAAVLAVLMPVIRAQTATLRREIERQGTSLCAATSTRSAPTLGAVRRDLHVLSDRVARVSGSPARSARIRVVILPLHSLLPANTLRHARFYWRAGGADG